MKKNYRFLIGIDPGTKTGLAVYDRKFKKLELLETTGIIRAMAIIREQYPFKELLARIEDARLRTWFGKAGVAQLQGAGSIKRDCSIWEEFCKTYNIDYELVKPKQIKTKTTQQYFLKLTGWEGITTNHARDAAMLVYGF